MAWTVLPALGPVLGVTGAPRVPEAVALASALISWLRGGAWAPDGLAATPEALWTSCLAWATAPGPAALHPWQAPHGRHAASIAALAGFPPGQCPATELKAAASAC